MNALRKKGIEHPRVLEAMNRVHRHAFVPDAFLHRAYRDEALPIGLNQTISQPYTVAYQTMLLDPKPRERILEIGTGSGYQAAVLCALGVELYSVERHAALLDQAKQVLRSLRYRLRTRLGDGSLGWPAFAPFDGILVTAGAVQVPEALKAQLRVPEGDTPGGRLIIPVGADGQRMYRITRTRPDAWQTEQFDNFRFVPLVGADGGHPETGG